MQNYATILNCNLVYSASYDLLQICGANFTPGLTPSLGGVRLPLSFLLQLRLQHPVTMATKESM